MRRRDAKQNGGTATKVSPAFSKAARSRTRSPCRAPQSAKSLIGVSFCLAFSLRLWLQRKSGEGVCRKRTGDESGGNPFREKGFPPLRFRVHAETFTPPSQKLLNKGKSSSPQRQANRRDRYKSFARLFKGGAVKDAQVLVVLRRARNLLSAFLFALPCCKQYVEKLIFVRLSESDFLCDSSYSDTFFRLYMIE